MEENQIFICPCISARAARNTVRNASRGSIWSTHLCCRCPSSRHQYCPLLYYCYLCTLVMAVAFNPGLHLGINAGKPVRNRWVGDFANCSPVLLHPMLPFPTGSNACAPCFTHSMTPNALQLGPAHVLPVSRSYVFQTGPSVGALSAWAWGSTIDLVSPAPEKIVLRVRQTLLATTAAAASSLERARRYCWLFRENLHACVRQLVLDARRGSNKTF